MKCLMFARMDKRAKHAARLKKKGYNFFFWTGKYVNGRAAYCISYEPLEDNENTK